MDQAAGGEIVSSEVEVEDEVRYNALLKNLEMAVVFAKPGGTCWRCGKCGFVHEGTQTLKTCLVCKHPQAFQEVAA